MIKQEFRAELLDKNGVVKCELNLTGGVINCNSSLSIKKGGNVSFFYPDVTRKEEDTPPPLTVTANSTQGGIKYNIGVDSFGILYTEQAKADAVVKYTGRLKVDDNGILFVDDNVNNNTFEFELRNSEGYYWDVYVTGEQGLYSETSNKPQFVYYTERKIDIKWLSDRIKIYYNKNSLGEYMMISPTRVGDIISTDLMDLNLLIQRKRPIEAVVFPKGYSYQDVLQYFIINAGIVKFIIEPTELVIPNDIVIDSSKNNLEWFNYIAEQINYTQLTVDNNGYFVSNKYVEPRPSNVKHTYKVNKDSVIIGDFALSQDLWNTPNIIKCVLSLPGRDIMKSISRNDNPTDEFSTYNIGDVLEVVEVDNVANQQELDLLSKKILFERRQVRQDIRFQTLINTSHGISDSVQIYSDNLDGVFIESEWSIPLVNGYQMDHVVSRLVNIKDVSI